MGRKHSVNQDDLGWQWEGLRIEWLSNSKASNPEWIFIIMGRSTVMKIFEPPQILVMGGNRTTALGHSRAFVTTHYAITSSEQNQNLVALSWYTFLL